MNTAECHSRARACLSGRYGEAFIVTAVCIFVFVTFRAAIMLSVNAIGDETFSWFAEGVLTALCFIIITPLLTGGVWWFYQTVSGGDNRSLLKLYSGFRLNRRAALLYIFMWLKGFISLFPTAVCWMAAYILIHGEYDISAEIAVFASFQLMVLGVVLITFFISRMLGTLLAPFIFIKRPDMNPFRVMRQSARLMKGHRLAFVKLTFKYVMLMLPLVTVPFVMPSAVMTAAVFANERLEDGQI